MDGTHLIGDPLKVYCDVRGCLLRVI